MAKTKALKVPKVFIALDVDDSSKALKFARLLKHKDVGFKIGPRLVNRYGAAFVKKVSKLGPVFIDQKFYDIPSTMIAAVQAAFDSGASYATIHALSGPKALSELAKLEKELNKKRPFKILAVTILTSYDEQSLPVGLRGQKISDLVQLLANECLMAGITGVVCSPFEAELLRAVSKDLVIVTPGVRGPNDAIGDQSRTMDAATAFKKGATALVVGRPILAAQKPKDALRQILK